MHLQSLHCYPLKSAAGLDMSTVQVTTRGLANDRRWMWVDGNGKFLSARSLPRMLLIQATIDAASGNLQLSAPGMAPLRVIEPTRAAPTIEVEVWESFCPARVAAAEACHWLSQFLQIEGRLVHMADDCLRAVDPSYAQHDDIVSFADGFPLMLIGSASLDALNRRASRPQQMTQFRPNLVVATTEPFIEDQWHRIRIGEIELDVVKPCVRCVLTTIDPDTGIKAADGEPLKTLQQFRRSDKGVTFGQNLIARSLGALRIGDLVDIVAD